jgi:hypothetical protein
MKTLLALSLAALVGSTTLVCADTSFSLPTRQDRDSIVELGTIRSDADGLVQLYAYNSGARGLLLGSEALRAGANPDVRVPLTRTGIRLALAEIVVDGQVVASQRVRFRD